MHGILLGLGLWLLVILVIAGLATYARITRR